MNPPWGIGPVMSALLLAITMYVMPQQQRASRFPHEAHASVFPACTTCHAGVIETGKPMFPDPVRCTACHDGVVERRVDWTPRLGPRPGDRKFTHEAHSRATTLKNPADSALIRNCAGCHNNPGGQRMQVKSAVLPRCLQCHGFDETHFNLPVGECARCHVPLTSALSITRDEIQHFPKPDSHSAPDFLLGGHGKLARVRTARGGMSVAASCATCHARNLCLSCHVNAPDSPVISALALDDRVPAYRGTLPRPASHASTNFIRVHGRDAQRPPTTCGTCHARESCLTCHVSPPPVVIAALSPSGAGRAPGVHLTRTPPSTHTREFTRAAHGPAASARPTSCETCHQRASCLECHRPDAGRQSRFHAASFLTRHPSAAYAREANCADCHNPAQFCQSCHKQSGLVATSRIGPSGYHDAFRGFSLGHGQAARQSLESCASCHAERDCTACHSAVGGGFRFNPHGPGFNAAKMKAKNPSLCVACHGRAVPG
jgi:hypothetical protein